jgi:DNA ligase 1
MTKTHHFDYVEKMVCDLRATSGTIEKENIINDYCNRNTAASVFAKNILLYVYHPMWQYNVTSDNLKKKNKLRGRDFGDIFFLLNALKDRQVTGHDAIGAVNTFVDNHSEYEDLIHCIVDKDLKTRAGDKIINKAIPDWIPEFSVALAEKYEPEIVDWKDGWYVSRKIDGARCVAVVDGSSDTIFYSRTGKTFDTLDRVADGIKTLGVKNVVFDGELCLVDKHGNEDFQGVMKELRKKNHVIENPSYKIFDMISHDEFYSKKGDSQKQYSHRYNNLLNIVQRSVYLSVLEQEKINNDDHFLEWTTKSSQNQWEGLILRADTPYKGKRSKELLKYKSFCDDEYVVLDVENGPFRYVKNGKEVEEKMLSCVVIEHKGHKVRVGSGFTIEQRQEFFKHPDRLINNQITVQYFSESENQQGGLSLRFPTFKCLHGKKREL